MSANVLKSKENNNNLNNINENSINNREKEMNKDMEAIDKEMNQYD